MRRRLLTLILFLLVVLPLAVGGCGDKGTGPAATSLQRALNDALWRHHLPGIAGAIIRSDSIETAVAGVRRLGFSSVIRIDDRFHLGSNTKAMTATLIARLVEEGRLTWESTPSSVFPELADSIRPEYRDITLTQLLSHRAGIPPFTEVTEFLALPDFIGTPMQQRRAFTAWLLHRPPATAPGQFLYSNAGYGIAGAMAERAAGESWESMLNSRLFVPLGIHGEIGWPAAADSNQPWGHWEESGKLTPHNPHDEYQLPAIIAPAGDVNMAITDYARFVQLHLRGLEGRPELLSSASFTRMHTPNGDYALGWVVQLIDGVKSSAHEGSAGTFYAIVVVQPTRDLAVVVLTNAGTDVAEQAISEVALTLLRL